MKIERCKTDVLIIGGGTAGCYAALTIADQSDAKVLICEKAHIKRSGCLAAGVNALNAYITEGRVPQDYVDYARKDADGICWKKHCRRIRICFSESGMSDWWGIPAVLRR